MTKHKTITLLFKDGTTDEAIRDMLARNEGILDRASMLMTIPATNGILQGYVPGIGQYTSEFRRFQRAAEKLNEVARPRGWQVDPGAQRITAWDLDFATDDQAERYVMIQAAGADVLALEAVRLLYYPARVEEIKHVLMGFPMYLKSLLKKLNNEKAV